MAKRQDEEDSSTTPRAPGSGDDDLVRGEERGRGVADESEEEFEENDENDLNDSEEEEGEGSF